MSQKHFRGFELGHGSSCQIPAFCTKIERLCQPLGTVSHQDARYDLGILWSQIRWLHAAVLQDASFEMCSSKTFRLHKSQVLEGWTGQDRSLGTCSSYWKVSISWEKEWLLDWHFDIFKMISRKITMLLLIDINLTLSSRSLVKFSSSR